MPKRLSKGKNIRDTNVLAAHIVEQSTGQPIPKNITEESAKNPAAVALGRQGGLKSAKARMEKLTPEMRKRIALKASWERWARYSIYDEIKATQVGTLLLKLNNHEIDYLKLIKLLYNIERESINRWIRPLIFDDLCSMPHGQVVSKTLDRAKPENQGVGTFWQEHIINSGNNVQLIKPANIDRLSKAEISLVEEMFERYRYKTPLEMRQEHHNPKLFPEYKDPGDSSIRTTYDDLLKVLGKTDEQIQDFRAELNRIKKLKEISL